jgi:hypothetical protein
MQPSTNKEFSMKAVWISMVAAAFAAFGAIAFSKPADPVPAAVAVQPCGENAGWIEIDQNTIACTLKNGKVMGTRSIK